MREGYKELRPRGFFIDNPQGSPANGDIGHDPSETDLESVLDNGQHSEIEEVLL